MHLSSLEDKLSKMCRRKWDQRGMVFALGRQCEHSFFYDGLGFTRMKRGQKQEGLKVANGKLKNDVGH